MKQLRLRQATGLAESLIELAGLHWKVPDYSTLCRRQKELSVTIGAQPKSKDLHLLVDSTGVKMLGEGAWKSKADILRSAEPPRNRCPAYDPADLLAQSLLHHGPPRHQAESNTIIEHGEAAAGELDGSTVDTADGLAVL